MTDLEPLLLRALALVPADARTEAGLSRADVEEYLGYNELDVAHGILDDFHDGAWRDGEFLELVAEAAELIRLGRVGAGPTAAPTATVIEYAGVGETRPRDR